MGIIADFIIASENEALHYGKTQSGIPVDDRLEMKSITMVELSTLLAILKGEEWHDGLLDLFPMLEDPADPELCVTRVPDELLGRLTASEHDWEQVAKKWAATEEMQWNPEDARTVIEELTHLALRAERLRKPIHLWNCT
jgi:hypothetical protein